MQPVPTCKVPILLIRLCVMLPCALIAVRAQGPPNRPRITGIDHVTIYVSDLAKSRNFYAGILGLNSRCPRFVGPESCFLVGPANQRVLLKSAKSGSVKNWLAEIAFATDDVEQMRGFLVAHGFSPGVLGKASDGARSFQVRDPEGNQIAFAQRSAVTVEYEPAPKQISTHLIHAGFVVKDLVAENRFY